MDCLVRTITSSRYRGLLSPLANTGAGMPLCANAFWRPCLRTTGHNSNGTNSTLGQPRTDTVLQMRSTSHFQSVALRHEYASDCLMRPFLTTGYLPRGCEQ